VGSAHHVGQSPTYGWHLIIECEEALLLRITYLKTVSPHLVGRATPDAAGKARPTVNHLTVMNYVKLNNK